MDDIIEKWFMILKVVYHRIFSLNSYASFRIYDRSFFFTKIDIIITKKYHWKMIFFQCSKYSTSYPNFDILSRRTLKSFSIGEIFLRSWLYILFYDNEIIIYNIYIIFKINILLIMIESEMKIKYHSLVMIHDLWKIYLDKS